MTSTSALKMSKADLSAEHTEKKIKREETEGEALVAPSALDPLIPSVPIPRNEGWTQFREWFGGGRSGQ